MAAAVLSCCAWSASAQTDWDSYRGIYLRQNYAAQVAAQIHASQSWELPGQRIKMAGLSSGTPGYGSATIHEGAGGSGAIVQRGVRGPGANGTVIDVQVRQVFPRQKVIDRIIQSLPIVGTAAAAALTIKDIIDAARVAEGPGGTVVMDRGQPEVSQSGWRGQYASDGMCYGITPGEVAACVVDKRPDSWTTGTPPNTTTWWYEAADLRPSGSNYVFTLQLWRRTTGGSGVYDNNPVTILPSTVVGCPPGQIVSFWADDWCTTDPGEWEVVDLPTARDRIDPKVAPGALPEIMRELDKNDIPVSGDLPSIQGPSEIHDGRETTQNPDGSTTVKDTYSPYVYSPVPAPDGSMAPGYEWGKREEVRTYPPGAEIPAPGGDTSGGTPGPITITEPGAGTGEDPITCGLPGTPPCKIDESGTPQAGADTSQEDAESAISGIRACFENPASCLPELPDLNWSFSLPADCSPIPVSGFAEVAGIESIDICQFQATFHDLASFLWVLAGLVGGVLLVQREAFGGGQ